MSGKLLVFAAAVSLITSSAHAICPYDVNCLNNPYGGRVGLDASGGVPVAPYGIGQPGSAFSANPLANSMQGVYDPYVPDTRTNANVGGTVRRPLSNWVGSSSFGAAGALKGVDRDSLGG